MDVHVCFVSVEVRLMRFCRMECGFIGTLGCWFGYFLRSIVLLRSCLWWIVVGRMSAGVEE